MLVTVCVCVLLGKWRLIYIVYCILFWSVEKRINRVYVFWNRTLLWVVIYFVCVNFRKFIQFLMFRKPVSVACQLLAVQCLLPLLQSVLIEQLTVSGRQLILLTSVHVSDSVCVYMCVCVLLGKWRLIYIVYCILFLNVEKWIESMYFETEHSPAATVVSVIVGGCCWDFPVTR